MTCGACEVAQTVYSPVDGSYCAAAPRASIGVGISRWLTSRCFTTTSASASAWSVASFSPQDQSMTMLPGAFSCSCGAPSAVACSASTTTSSGSQSTSISASASSAASRLSATTAATPAPVKVTRSISSALGVLTKFSTPPACHAHGSGGRCSKSLPVTTAITPGTAAAFVVSMLPIRACAYGERRIAT